MRSRLRKVAAGAALAAAVAVLPGCLVAAAAAAGAGAGAGVYLTRRGASSLVEGSVEGVSQRVLAVFDTEGVRRTASEMQEDSSGREYRGSRDELEITVRVERESATVTRTTVYAQRSAVEWDREYARTLLERIVARR